MNGITTKQFQILTDCQLVWDLLTENHSLYFETGPAAPFFEYAVTSTWLNKDYLYRNRFWMDGDRPVAFVFYEAPETSVFFHLRPGYEALAGEMIEYAENMMPGTTWDKELVLYPAQTALRAEAEKRGYSLDHKEQEWLLDMDRALLRYPLPAGFHFVDPLSANVEKLAECTWKGFDHEDKGPFENWLAPDPGTPWNPQKSFNGILSSTMAPPPHATYRYNVIIANEREDYVCFSGMWWVKENRLAYMEPLCTVPECRKMGLAAAALSRHCEQLRPLGARIMTGGGSDFYRKVGYTHQIWHEFWKKQG